MTEPLIMYRPFDGDAPTDIVGFTATQDGTGDDALLESFEDEVREAFGRVAWRVSGLVASLLLIPLTSPRINWECRADRLGRASPIRSASRDPSVVAIG